MRNGQVVIRDLGSTNGTFVNQALVRQEQHLRAGDVIQVGSTTLLLSASVDPIARPARAWWSAVAVAVSIVLFGAVVLLASRDNRLPAADGLPALQPAAAMPTAPSLAVSPSTLERARLATVQVVGIMGGGSGSVVDPRGYILTNYHVVAQEPVLLIVPNSPAQDAPPDLAYQAEIVASDRDLDLALLRIVADDAGRTLAGALNFVSLPIGDLDQVRLGDSIDILGFPDVGGATVTLTKGTVAGFIEDNSGRARGWIKTDAEISPGNSGGVAINLAGDLIGVPSLVSSEDRTLG